MQFTRRHLSTIRRFVTRLKIFLWYKFHWRNKERIIIIPWLIWSANGDEFSPKRNFCLDYPLMKYLYYCDKISNLFEEQSVPSKLDWYLQKKKKKDNTSNSEQKFYFSTIVIFINLIQFLNRRYKPKIKFFSRLHLTDLMISIFSTSPNLTPKPFRRNTLITLLDKPTIPITIY